MGHARLQVGVLARASAPGVRSVQSAPSQVQVFVKQANLTERLNTIVLSRVHDLLQHL
jgi:hypothetical protein